MKTVVHRGIEALGLGTLLLLAMLTSGCGKKPAEVASAPRANATAAPKSSDCRACHEDVYKSWSDSHHALANRPVDREADADAITPALNSTVNGIAYELDWKDGRPALIEKRGPQPADSFSFTAEFVLGHSPIRQYVVPIGGGRYQTAELTFDPVKKEWFNVFGDEKRLPGEWGHWRGRGMNWNSMCAHCHMTDYKKNYDPISDTYATTWREHGVGCTQCHGDLTPEHAKPKPANAAQASVPGATTGSATPALFSTPERKRAQETCAPCHARNELLTGSLVPGAPYSDHYRLTSIT